MAEGGDCISNRGRGRGLPYGKPTERPALQNSGVFTKEMVENIREFSPRSVSKPSLEEVRSDVKVPQQMRTLRHDAPEFVPRSSCLTISNSAQPENESNHVDEFAENLVNVNLMRQLKELIDNLAIDPGQYDIIQDSILELLISCMTSDDALKDVVDTIFNRSVSDQNLTYSGARLCNHLSQNILSDKGPVFRNALMARCQNEVKKRDKQFCSADSQTWLRGVVHFIGELYIHLEIVGDEETTERYTVLGTGLLELLEFLLNNHSEENFKSVARVLKFTGAALDEDHKSHQPNNPMDSLMKKIEGLWNNNISRSAKEQFKKIIDLRSSNWGCAVSPRVAHEEPFIGDYNCGEPVLYGPDGQPLTSEESQFLESNQRFYDDDYDEYPDFGPNEWSTEDDQMDEEIEAAFEEFLAQHPGCNQFQNS